MKVAVIGCSHSDTDFRSRNWVAQLAEKYPNHTFHNYSTVGGGQLDIDLTLKYFVHNKLKFDKVILQFSGNNRWAVPSVGHYIDFENAYVTKQLSYNHSAYKLNVPRARTSRIYTREELQNVAKGYWSNGRVIPEDEELIADEKSFKIGYAHYFSELFMNTFHIYPYDFIYWTFRPSNHNNLGLDLCAHDWFTQNHPVSYAETYTDDTLHLNEIGNTVLLEQYLKIKL